MLRRREPNFQEKISLICGDFRSPGLGLSEEDKDLLKQNVNFIFHIAATVRFDQHIKTAFTINVQGTQEMLNLAKECTNLKVSYKFVLMILKIIFLLLMEARHNGTASSNLTLTNSVAYGTRRFNAAFTRALQ